MFSADILLYLPKHFNLYNMEEFRDIKGYEGLYQVSNFGRIKSLWFGKEKILKEEIDNDGYRRVMLYKNKIGKHYKIHRLVYITFIGEIDDDKQVNHLNEDKADNSIFNLNLLTSKENINYGSAIQRRADKRSKTVIQFTKDNEFVREYKSIHEAGKINNIQFKNISSCCLGKRKTCGGFIWKYKEE